MYFYAELVRNSTSESSTNFWPQLDLTQKISWKSRLCSLSRNFLPSFWLTKTWRRAKILFWHSPWCLKPRPARETRRVIDELDSSRRIVKTQMRAPRKCHSITLSTLSARVTMRMILKTLIKKSSEQREAQFWVAETSCSLQVLSLRSRLSLGDQVRKSIMLQARCKTRSVNFFDKLKRWRRKDLPLLSKISSWSASLRAPASMT